MQNKPTIKHFLSRNLFYDLLFSNITYRIAQKWKTTSSVGFQFSREFSKIHRKISLNGTKTRKGWQTNCLYVGLF